MKVAKKADVVAVGDPGFTNIEKDYGSVHCDPSSVILVLIVPFMFAKC